MSAYFKKLRVAWILETIEIYGFINREHVEKKFGVSTPQASQDIGDALRQDNRVVYDASAKRYMFVAGRE